MKDRTPRMDPGELQAVREYLGLTTEHLASMLGIRNDTLRRWESGREMVPHRVREEIEDLEAVTARAVGELVAALQDARDLAVRVYRTDEAMHRDRPDMEHLPARWWRHVVMRACEEVPGVEVFSGLSPWRQAGLDQDEYVAHGEDGEYVLTLMPLGWCVLDPSGMSTGSEDTFAAAQQMADEVHRRRTSPRAGRG